jgi:hypothetical protein
MRFFKPSDGWRRPDSGGHENPNRHRRSSAEKDFANPLKPSKNLKIFNALHDAHGFSRARSSTYSNQGVGGAL